MARYIDAEKFEKEMYHEAFETDSDMQKWDSGCWIRYKMLENCIAQQPTADVVEVVRCKDCEYGEIDDIDIPSQYLCHYEGYSWNDENHYCSYGKKVEYD